MAHKYWPAGATLIAEVFGFNLISFFPEFDGFLDWTEWAHDADKRYSERIPPHPIVKSWETRAEYPSAKQLFQEGLPVAGALSELQWRLYDVVCEAKIHPQALDLASNRPLRLSTSSLRPSSRPVLGRGVWFDSALPRPKADSAEFAEIGSVFFDRVDASQIRQGMNERWPAGGSVDNSGHSLGSARERARHALLCLFGRTERQAGISQEALHAQVNEFLSKRHLPGVSESTVRRVLGERR
jgi:hypothetical protein